MNLSNRSGHLLAINSKVRRLLLIVIIGGLFLSLFSFFLGQSERGIFLFSWLIMIAGLTLTAVVAILIRQLVIGLGKLNQDILNTQTQLYESAERFKALTENISDFYWESDHTGVIVSCEGRVGLCLGYEPEEIIGKKPNDFMPPDEEERIIAFAALLGVSGKQTGEISNWAINKDGKLVNLFSNVMIIKDKDGDTKGYQGITNNITDRKLAQETIIENERLFRTAIEKSPVYLTIQTQNERYIHVSDGAMEFTGYTRREMTGKRPIELGLIYDKEDRRKMRDILSSGKRVKDHEIAVRVRKGDIKNLLISIEEIEIHHEPHLLAIGQDITHLKEAEKARIESEEKFRKAFDFIPGALSINRMEDGTIIEVNQGFVEMYGFSREEATGFNSLELGIWTDREQVNKRQNDLLDAGAVRNLEIKFRKKNGELGAGLNSCCIVSLEGRDHILSITIDITEMKRAEEALRESEEKFRVITDSALDAVIMMDDSGNIVHWNKAAEDMFGYSSEEIKGKNLHATLVPSEYLEFYKKGFIQFSKEGSGPVVGKLMELKALHQDGSEFPIEISVSSINMKGTWWAVGIVRDIAARKDAEEALKNSEKQFRELIENINEVIFQTDMVGNMTYISPAVESIMGRKADDVVGRPFTDFICPEDLTRIEKEFEQALGGGGFPSEYRVVHGSGKYKWVQSYSNPLYQEGELIGIQGILADVHDRRQAEEALRESEEKYRNLVDRASDGIAVVHEKKMIYVNNRLADMTGYEIEELTGLEFSILIPEDILPLIMDNYQRRVSGESIPSIYEAKLRKKNGEILNIEFNVGLIHMGDDPMEMVMVRDITERLLAEKQVRKLEEQLQQSRKMEAVGTLAGGIAHDFNNILTIIMGYAQLALGKSPAAPIKKDLDRLMEASIRAMDLVKHILTFSRQTEQNRKPLSMIQAVNETLKFIRASLPATNEIRKHIESGEDSILADPTQIHQIIMNLCVNASQAMGEKGGVITIHLENVNVSEREADLTPELEVGSYVCLNVSDTGPGIPREIADKIFDPYFTTKKVGEGTGLGLATVHGIVRSHGGAIFLKSEPGQGALFTVYLPLIEEAAGPEAGLTIIPEKGAERILLVDDEESITEVGRELLQNLGYHVETRTASREALEAFRAAPDKYDLVITDQTMPNMTGLDLASELRKIKPDLPIILCSGFSININQKRAKASGVKAFVMKPFLIEQLSEAVRTALKSEA